MNTPQLANDYLSRMKRGEAPAPPKLSPAETLRRHQLQMEALMDFARQAAMEKNPFFESQVEWVEARLRKYAKLVAELEAAEPGSSARVPSDGKAS